MNVTNNECVAGILQMRRAYPVPHENVQEGERKGHKVATCHECGHPNVTVIKKGEGYVYSGHKLSVKSGGLTEGGNYSQRRERNW